MAEAPVQPEPINHEKSVFDGVTIARALPMQRWSLRARQPEALSKLLDIEIPARIGETLGAVACLGPDEWLLRLPIGSTIPDGADSAVSVVEIGDRAVCLTLEGARAAEILMAGCPRDVAGFAQGYATRTVFEGVEIVVFRTGDERFEVEAWRSFAPWLWTALTTAAIHLTDG